jgi:Mg2+ and Co2+ transporter CorA
MNEQSLKESNALLAAATARTEVGQLIPASPAELAGESGIQNRLSTARAVRALIARGRIAQDPQGYRLLDVRPLEPGEPATVHRPTRRRRKAEATPENDGLPTYEGVGRAVIERLIESSAEVAELRTALDRARTEADAARREAMEATRNASADRRKLEAVQDEATALKQRLEMTESNLRTLVDAAKSRPASPLEDTDAQAILDILSRKDGT